MNKDDKPIIPKRNESPKPSVESSPEASPTPVTSNVSPKSRFDGLLKHVGPPTVAGVGAGKSMTELPKYEESKTHSVIGGKSLPKEKDLGSLPAIDEKKRLSRKHSADIPKPSRGMEKALSDLRENQKIKKLKKTRKQGLIYLKGVEAMSFVKNLKVLEILYKSQKEEIVISNLQEISCKKKIKKIKMQIKMAEEEVVGGNT